MLQTDGSEFLRPIHLHGALGERFGRRHVLSVETPAEAVRALCAQHRGFRAAISEGSWRIVCDDPETGLALGEEDLYFQPGNAALHIVPVVAGAGGNKGLGKVIAGIALVAASFLIPGSATLLGISLSHAVFGIGVSLALQGASSLLTAKPAAVNNRTDNPQVQQDARASFLFSGADRVVAQGGAVPLVFGRMRAPGLPISVGLTAAQI